MFVSLQSLLCPLSLQRSDERDIVLTRSLYWHSRWRDVCMCCAQPQLCARFSLTPQFLPVRLIVWLDSWCPCTGVDLTQVTCCPVEAADLAIASRALDVCKLASSVSFFGSYSVSETRWASQWCSYLYFISCYLVMHVQDCPCGTMEAKPPWCAELRVENVVNCYFL